jgi:RES domain
MYRRSQNFFRQLEHEREDAEKMFICQQCVRDEMLEMMNPALQSERRCAACGKQTRTAFTPNRIARFIREYLPKHFIVDDDLYPGHALDLKGVVGRAIGCENITVCEAIGECMVDPSAKEEDFYWPGQEYRLAPSPFESEDQERGYVVGRWIDIANELTRGRRFFNDQVREFFESLMHEALNAESPDRPGAAPVIKILPSGTDFYRGRLARGLLEVKKITDAPKDQLDVPPSDRAPNNRMSPAGIPLFYLAGAPDTCIAEVRPSIGDSVVIGQFRSSNDLKFFDFTALSERLEHRPLSFFDPLYDRRLLHRRLLTYLHEEISRPVRAGDTDYVVTQALAEYIRYDTTHHFNGVIYRSAQHNGGINFVIFDKSNVSGAQIADRRPAFNLNLVPNTVSVHEITSVHYGAERTGEV